MKNLMLLIKGELLRLVRYKVLPIAVAISVLWVVILALISPSEAMEIAPLLIFTDAALMSILLLAASFFFERQEGTIRTLFITPVSLLQILVSKVVGAILVGLISTLLLSVSCSIIHKIDINYFSLILIVVFIIITSSAVGLTLSLYSKDFNSVLVNYVIYIMIFFVPPLLYILGVIPQNFEKLLIISPIFANYQLILSVFSAVDLFYIVGGIIYLVFLSAFLYLIIVKKFKSVAIGG